MFSNKQLLQFSDLDMSIYNYVTCHAEKVIYMRIRELADETHVSPTTILRFCKKIGCDGYAEFKVKLKLFLSKTTKKMVTPTSDSFQEFCERLNQEDFNNTLEKAVSVISACEWIIFTGVGSSGILAEYGARYFSSLNRLSLHIKDPYLPIHSNYLKTSATIALSVSGQSEPTLSHVSKLKAEGSKIISITNSTSNSLAKISDVNIPYFISMEMLKNTNITSQIPVIFVIESLAKTIYSERSVKN